MTATGRPPVEPFSEEEAQEYLRKMYQRIVVGWGGADRAIDELCERCGMTFSAITHILKGRARSVSLTHYGKIRKAYRQFLEEERQAIEAEIAAEDAKDAAFIHDDFLTEIEALQARLETLRSQLRNK